MSASIHIGQRDLNITPYHWKRPDIKELYSQPTLLFMGGSNASTATINGALKYLSHCFTSPTDMRLFGCNYSGHSAHQDKATIQFEANQLSDKEAETYLSTDKSFITQLFNQCFLSLISDETGNRLPVDECARRMRNLTIITHCYGSIIAYEIDQLLAAKMQKLGYLPQEREDILQSLNIINMASRTPIGKAHTNMVHIVSLNDSFWLNNWKAETVNALIEKMAFDELYKPQGGYPLMYFQPSVHEKLFLLPQIQKTKDNDHSLEYYITLNHPQRQPLAQKVFSIVESFLMQKSLNINATFQSVLNQPENNIFMKTLQEGETYFQKIYNAHLVHSAVGRVLLPAAVKKNQLKNVEHILKGKIIPYDLKDKNGHFPLYYAIQNQSIEMVNLFLNYSSYHDIVSLQEENTPLWQHVLHTKNNSFIKAFLSEIYKKNIYNAPTDISPYLKKYCFQSIGKEIDCSAILPFAFHFSSQKTYVEQVAHLLKIYQCLPQKSSPVSQKNKESLLSVAQILASNQYSYTNKAGDAVFFLKKENAPEELINIFHKNLLNFLLENQKNIKQDLNILLYGRTPDLPVTQILSSNDRIGERAYLNKIKEHFFWNGTQKAEQILNRLEKRYTRLTQKILQNYQHELMR